MCWKRGKGRKKEYKEYKEYKEREPESRSQEALGRPIRDSVSEK